MKRLLSLFDYSGQWSQPFANVGWDVIYWDIKFSELRDIMVIADVEWALDHFENIDGILAAVPCTEFANAGARWFKEKDEDGRTAKAIELVNQVQKLADLFTPTDFEFYDDPENTFFWAIENPVGRIATLIPELGEPYYFQPHEFAGHLDLPKEDIARLDLLRSKDGKGLSRGDIDFVLKCNAYTKKTGLWGDFNTNLIKKNIEPVKCNKYGSPMMSYGGKSEKTKENRSNTPQGFAQAFFEAQLNHQAEILCY